MKLVLSPCKLHPVHTDHLMISGFPLRDGKTYLGINHESHGIGDITLISHDLGWEQSIEVDLSSLEGPCYRKYMIMSLKKLDLSLTLGMAF
jgi:hypothetical protein